MYLFVEEILDATFLAHNMESSLNKERGKKDKIGI